MREVLDGGDPLGRRIRYVNEGESGSWFEIVGVVADFPAPRAVPGRTQARLYHPVAPGGLTTRRLAVRVTPDVRDGFESTLRGIAAAVDPSLRIRVAPVADLDDVGMIWGASAFVLLTLSVMLLSAAGIHALMSFIVTRRRKEIGIRMALGADRGRILRSIFSRALLHVGIGVLLGLIGGRLFLGDGGYHTVFLLGIVSFVTLVGLVAALGPARRALRLQPIETLREE